MTDSEPNPIRAYAEVNLIIVNGNYSQASVVRTDKGKIYRRREQQLVKSKQRFPF